MTKHFSLSVLAILASFSVSAATLDVHGEIKVNGKTVIDAQGNVINNQEPLIDLNDYFNSEPNSTVTLITPTKDSIKTDNYKLYYDSNGRLDREERIVDNKIMWSMEWTKRTTNPLTSTTITTSLNTSTDDNGNTIITSENKKEAKNTFSSSTGYPLASIGVNITRADIFTQEIINSTNTEEVGTIFNASEYQYLVILDKISVKTNDLEIKDCILVLHETNYHKKNFRTYCKNYGLVEFDNYKLQSVE